MLQKLQDVPAIDRLGILLIAREAALTPSGSVALFRRGVQKVVIDIGETEVVPQAPSASGTRAAVDRQRRSSGAAPTRAMSSSTRASQFVGVDPEGVADFGR